MDVTVSVANAGTRTEEEAIRRLRGQTVTLRYAGCDEYRYARARYEFDFSAGEWRREMVCFHGAKDSGQIPADIAEEFFGSVWPVLNLPEKIYFTDTSRLVPGSAKERRLFKGKIKCLSKFHAQICGKVFSWVIERDTDEPYGLLTSAFQALLAALDI